MSTCDREEMLRRFRDCLARATQRENGFNERIESWMLATDGDEPWPSLVLERNLASAEVLAYRNAVARLEPLVPKLEPYRPWVVNLNPQGQRYGRVGCVTNAGNGKADVAYDDGVGMHVDIKKHLVLVADLGFIDKERLRCGCGSGFPSLWCCWNKEPTKRETRYAPRVTHRASGRRGTLIRVCPTSTCKKDGLLRVIFPLERTTPFPDGVEYRFALPISEWFVGALVAFDDGENMLELVTAEKYALAPDDAETPIAGRCGCGGDKPPVVCHPMSRPMAEPLE